jgi:hypothetical protein
VAVAHSRGRKVLAISLTGGRTLGHKSIWKGEGVEIAISGGLLVTLESSKLCGHRYADGKFDTRWQDRRTWSGTPLIWRGCVFAVNEGTLRVLDLKSGKEVAADQPTKNAPHHVGSLMILGSGDPLLFSLKACPESRMGSFMSVGYYKLGGTGAAPTLKMIGFDKLGVPLEEGPRGGESRDTSDGSGTDCRMRGGDGTP